MSIRAEKVASVVRQELGIIISRECNGSGEYGFATVTETRMTPDLRTARIFVSIMGDAEKRERTLQYIESQKGHYRSLIGGRLKLRFTPVLEFFHDTSLDNAMHIEALIKKIHQDEGRSEG